ncbi:hypothetical protein Hanom_Chr05g00440621 [Helianthus anomalus]
MLEALYLPETWHGTLYRRNLRINAKLFLVICVHNVIPCRGDTVEVRYPEVPILYTLLHVVPLFPFHFLVLNNIWISQNSVGRKIIPHCRLITTLLKMYVGTISQAKESEGQRWHALKVDARPLNPGEADEPESGDEPQSGHDDYADDTNVEAREVEEWGSNRSGRRRGGSTQPIFARGVFDYTRQ